jgi:pimeloyl-ACP methyl ester carboxylesterase
MTTCLASVNGIKIAYRVQGEGPPLVLIMGYRLNSIAWPAALVEQLARRFTVITLDNRGTGLSDKPVKGYAIANMARDVSGVLDALGIAQVHVLGYSMGGAIAQEFVRQFPNRVSGLILCATMAGGSQAKYARSSVVATLRDLDGLSPEQAARRIWRVTYSPDYLEHHRDLAEDQMRREVALPTPLHAADLQFQAFAEFDGSKALAEIRCPTLILTGDLDELIPPQNAMMMASLIPGAELVVIPRCGHRVLWEATQSCVDLITEFLGSFGSTTLGRPEGNQRYVSTPSDALTSAIELAIWPLTLARAGFESMAAVRQLLLLGTASRFGDGKPIILVPQFFGTDFALFPLAIWLKALGYRTVTTGPLLNLQVSSGDSSLSRVIHDITRRVGRKAVLITHSFGMTRALTTADFHKERISDVVVIGAARSLGATSVRTHFVSALHAMTELRQLLRGIDLELIEASDIGDPESELATGDIQARGTECFAGSEGADGR